MSADAVRIENGISLTEGDVIEVEDGTRHTLTQRHTVDGISIVLETDTGLRITKTWYQAQNSRYTVVGRTSA